MLCRVQAGAEDGGQNQSVTRKEGQLAPLVPWGPTELGWVGLQ